MLRMMAQIIELAAAASSPTRALPPLMTMHSWDRMPFLTRVLNDGGDASYTAAMTATSHSMIYANYGASQGFDNDGVLRMQHVHCVWNVRASVRHLALHSLSHHLTHPIHPDGSSWYETHDNFFYDASGFKMDYGKWIACVVGSAHIWEPSPGKATSFKDFAAAA